jgi:hypothetical protein
MRVFLKMENFKEKFKKKALIILFLAFIYKDKKNMVN